MSLPDGPELAQLCGQIEAIIAATKGVEMPGAFMSNRVYLDLAVERLRLYHARVQNGASEANCFCRLFDQSQFMSPQLVVRRGRVEILDQTVLRAAHSTVSDVRCTDCGALWRCRDENGWHIPTYAWTPLSG